MFVKDYGFLSVAKSMSKNIGKDRSKHLSGNKSQKLVDHAEQPTADAFKIVSKRAIQKIAEVIGDLDIKLLIKLQESQKLQQEIIQKQMKKKYLQKDSYLQN